MSLNKITGLVNQEKDLTEKQEIPLERRLGHLLRTFRTFALHVWHRFNRDNCRKIAASLSFTSLLAVVPFAAIAFSMLASFPAFADTWEKLQEAIFSYIIPETASEIREHFNQFVSNTGKLTTIGIIGLAATAILLLFSIESEFNSIFRVKKPRRLISRFLVYWTLLTLGPLLLGVSLSLSAYFFAMTTWVDQGSNAENFSWLVRWTGYLAPTAIMIGVLALAFMIIPNRRISPVAALLGGGVGGLLLSLLRQGFEAYISGFPSYQTIYGAVATVPILLVYTYLVWLVVLFGATVAAVYEEWPDIQTKD